MGYTIILINKIDNRMENIENITTGILIDQGYNIVYKISNVIFNENFSLSFLDKNNENSKYTLFILYHEEFTTEFIFEHLSERLSRIFLNDNIISICKDREEFLDLLAAFSIYGYIPTHLSITFAEKII